jgi:hypothetical protein
VTRVSRRQAMFVVLALCAVLPAERPVAQLAVLDRAVEACQGVRYLEHGETTPRPLRLLVAQIDLRAPGRVVDRTRGV